MKNTPLDYQDFKEFIFNYYEEQGRKYLPWRVDPTPYNVLVSEMMLQQTQVSRVIDFFNRWIEKFPDFQTLAQAKQTEVLALWKGLGYNNRALRLHKLAQIVTEQYQGILPKDMKSLMALPGIGHYTAGAIRAFSFNIYTAFIETNIRRVFIHHFFQNSESISDEQIFAIINAIGEVENPSDWYNALMDYGSTLPKQIKKNPNKKSKHYSKQSKFEGSDRQIRGNILKVLLEIKDHKITLKTLLKHNDFSHINEERLSEVIDSLVKDGFIEQKDSFIILIE